MSEPSADRRALYLRWRPLGFSDVVGQEHVVRTLRNAVASGSPAHAYLFAGPRGTGKTSLARILYRAVNCLAPRGGDPCGECDTCRAALAGRALDLIEIDAASNRGIDDIRDLREKVNFAPSEARYRVYIVDEAHELTAPAWDAFLKTLEEPPPHALFVLATTEAHKVPPTIVSRCQRFDFRRIKPESIRDRLLQIAADEQLQLDPAAADRLARMARGGLRDAISLLDQAASFTAGAVDLAALREVLGLVDTPTVQSLIETIGRGDAANSLAILTEQNAAGSDLRLLASELAAQLRGLVYAAVGAATAVRGDFSSDELAWLEHAAQSWEPARAQQLLRAIGDGLVRIRDSSQFQIHFELALLAACLEQPGPEPHRALALTAEPDVIRVSRPPSQAVLPRSELPRPPVLSTGAPGSKLPELDPPPTIGPAQNGAPAVAQVVGADVHLELIVEHWPRVVEWVRNRRPLLSSYLSPAAPRSYADGWLVLGLGFKLHCDKLNERQNLEILEQACVQVIGHQLRVRCELEVAATSGEGLPDLLSDPLLKFALEKFGGRAELVDQ